MRNILFNLKLLILSARRGLWRLCRWPLMMRVTDGYRFTGHRRLVETEVRRIVENSPVIKLLKDIKDPVVIVTSVYHGYLYVNAYKAVKREGPVCLSAFNSRWGLDGTFTYLITDRFQVVNNSQEAQGWRYVEVEPGMSFKLSLSRNRTQFFDDMVARDNPADEMALYEATPSRRRNFFTKPIDLGSPVEPHI